MKSKFSAKGSKLEKLSKKKSQTNTVKIGVFGSAGQSKNGDLTNAQLAIIHEFGTARTPSRSFLRSTFDEKNKEWRKFIEAMSKRVFEGDMDELQVLGLLGEKAVADIREKIRSGIAPTLKASTIKRKGSSKPLIDSGRLLNSIGWQVVKSE